VFLAILFAVLVSCQTVPSSSFIKDPSSGEYLSAVNNPYLGSSPSYYTFTLVSGTTNTYSISQGGTYISALVNGGGYNTNGAGESYNQFVITYVGANQVTIFSQYLQNYNGYGWLAVIGTPYGPYSPYFSTSSYTFTLSPGGWLNTFSVISASAQWPSGIISGFNGYAYNVLPTNNPSAATSPFWDAANNWNEYYAPYWVTFDLGADYTVYAFEYKAIGDGTHDPSLFYLQTSSSSGGTYSTVATFTGTGSTNAMQVFTLSTPATARYWAFSIQDTVSQYQSWVAYVNFAGYA